MKKVIVLIISFVFAFNFGLLPCSAEEINSNEIYNEHYKASGADGLDDYLTDDVREYMQDIDLSKPLDKAPEILNAENVFDIIKDFFKNNIKTPLSSGLLIISILLISAALGSIYDDSKIMKYVTTVSISVSALIPAISTVLACAEAIKSAGVFMLGFLPVFVMVLAQSGKSVTAAGFYSVMTVATELVTTFCSFIAVPLSGMQLALGLSGAISDDIKTVSVGKLINKVSMWSLSLITTVFLSILGLQTAINSPADNLYSKTAKFVLGTAVPVVGTVVSEALGTVRGCMSLLKSSVMIYGVIAVVLTVLPIIVQLIVWRAVFWCTSAVAEMFSVDSACFLIKAVDSTFAFILGLIILVLILFIISLTIVSVV